MGALRNTLCDIVFTGMFVDTYPEMETVHGTVQINFNATHMVEKEIVNESLDLSTKAIPENIIIMMFYRINSENGRDIDGYDWLLNESMYKANKEFSNGYWLTDEMNDQIPSLAEKYLDNKKIFDMIYREKCKRLEDSIADKQKALEDQLETLHRMRRYLP